MNLISNEEILMYGDNKQITLTTHRIRQENTEWGKLHLSSIMLEHITSCEYSRKSNPVLVLFGIGLICIGVYFDNNNSQEPAAGFFIIGILLIIGYFYTTKRGLTISSPSAKITLNTKGMKDENIKLFIDNLESAKNERYGRTRIN